MSRNHGGNQWAEEQPPNRESNKLLTLRMLVYATESIALIGPGCENIIKSRRESGALITLTDGSVSERILTIAGNLKSVTKASRSILLDIDEFINKHEERKPMFVNFIIPLPYCGTIIGKGGVNIREMRENSGAIINLCQDNLPLSTERLLTISGDNASVCNCVDQLCALLHSCPVNIDNSSFVPYCPSKEVPTTPLVVSNGQTYIIYKHLAIPTCMPVGYVKSEHISTAIFLAIGYALASNSISVQALCEIVRYLGLCNARDKTNITSDMFIPNELMECLTGKVGKINDIGLITKATVTAHPQENTGESSTTRVSIKGNNDSVVCAKHLISMMLESYKAMLEGTKLGASLKPFYLSKLSPLITEYEQFKRPDTLHNIALKLSN